MTPYSVSILFVANQYKDLGLEVRKMIRNNATRVQMLSGNLIYNVTRVTRNLLVPPALDAVEAVATVFADKGEESVDITKSDNWWIRLWDKHLSAQTFY
jgi:hypothetical protein